MRVTFGLDTFGDVTRDAAGELLPHDKVIRDVLDEAVLADELGVDAIGLGEHHRKDFAITAPEVLLAAIGARTKRILLGTAVTVLSTDDPVRAFERFSTLNALSSGRAEAVLGRGSFTESFPLFGFDLSDYELLFEERLDLFTRLIRDEAVTWSGTTRAALKNQRVFPTLGPGGLSAWVGVGGSPESVVRAVRHDLPMMLAIIGGDPRRFRPFVDLYRRAQAELGRDARPLGIHSPGHVATTDEEAREQAWPAYKQMFDRIGGERGWPPVTRERYIGEIDDGALHIGSPDTVARKIAGTVVALGAQRFQMKYSLGTLGHDALMRSIELFGGKVIPMVRDMLAATAPGQRLN